MVGIKINKINNASLIKLMIMFQFYVLHMTHIPSADDLQRRFSGPPIKCNKYKMRNVERIFEKGSIQAYKISYSTHFPTGGGVQKDRKTPPTKPAGGRDKSSKLHMTEGEA